MLRSAKRIHHIRRNAMDRIFHSQKLSQAGKTPFDLIYSNSLVSLRHYARREQGIVQQPKYRVPIVIVPPLAVNMLIYDLYPTRSLVRFLMDQGFDVYLINWGEPGLEETHYDVGTYIQQFMPEFLRQVRAHSGQVELTLHGWSLGGAMAVAYTALYQDTFIRNLVVLGAPIDMHNSGFAGRFLRFLHRRAVWIRHNTTFRLHRFPSRMFHVHGISNTIGFKLTDPVGNLKGYWELVGNLDKREYVINHATSSAFLDHMLAYPGGVMRDVILRFWIDNELSSGVMYFEDGEANLKLIQSTLLAFGGNNDNIVTADAVRTLMNLVGSTDKEFMLVPGGHMGIVSGSKAPETIWAKTAAWLQTRSD